MRFVCVVQLEEVRSVPANSEQVITETSARKDELEKKKVLEEQKLAQVMESLKEETSGLQDEKEVASRTHLSLFALAVFHTGFCRTGCCHALTCMH